MRGKLILIEGTDGSGKRTQAEKLVKRLCEKGEKVAIISFPMYETPTGKIIGGPYLGKEKVCKSWFEEGATNVEPRVSSLYYAADRLYNKHKITKLLDGGTTVILDRYTTSNMAHQGGKIEDKEKRYAIYKWLEDLEYGFLQLPRPDFTFLLHMPHEFAQKLRMDRREKLDAQESSEKHLLDAEKSYLEIAKLYNFEIISCVDKEKIRSVEEISDDLYELTILKIDYKS